MTARASWEGTQVTVALGSALSATWARQYLSPYVNIEAAPAPHDDELPLVFHYGIDVAPPSLGSGEPVALHSGRLGRWHDLGRFLVVVRPNDGIVYVIDRERRRAHVVMSSVTPETVREPARHVRELLLNSSHELRGFRPVHCSGLAVDDGVVLVVGVKGRGKTSTLLRALGRQSVDYFCNDRALIGTVNGRLHAYPYPFSCRIGAGTALAHPTLALHMHGFDHTLARVRPLAEQYNDMDKLELTAQELASILGVGIRTQRLPVLAVVEPHLALDGRPPATTPLSPVELNTLIAHNVFRPDPDRLGWLADEICPLPEESTPAPVEVPGFRAVGSAAQISDVAVAQLTDSGGVERSVLDPGAPAPTERWIRRPLAAKLVTVMDHRRADRGLKLSGYTSRAVRRDDVHEFILTCKGAAFLRAASYIGFAAFTESGVLVKDDVVSVGGRRLGRIAGFDLTHADNHLNIVIESDESEVVDLPTGRSLGLRIDADLKVECLC